MTWNPIRFVPFGLLAAVAAACTTQDSRREEPANDAFEQPLPRTTVPSVMQAKLAHAQALLEGITKADFPLVERNALALKEISQGADWLAHESPAYFALSAEFRTTCDDLVTQARDGNIRALAATYGSLANSCVSCHAWLRREREVKDMPGRVSDRSGATAFLAAK
jgi:hypothetical protein